MPELAELRLTADYINEAAKGKAFKNPKRNPVHKWDPLIIPRDGYGITAQSRGKELILYMDCLLYTSPSPRDLSTSRMPSSA